jgi:hypothetical protein
MINALPNTNSLINHPILHHSHIPLLLVGKGLILRKPDTAVKEALLLPHVLRQSLNHSVTRQCPHTLMKTLTILHQQTYPSIIARLMGFLRVNLTAPIRHSTSRPGLI